MSAERRTPAGASRRSRQATKRRRAQGNRPRVGLLLIDVINPFTFEGGSDLLRHATPAARRIKALKQRAHKAALPIIYVNDNFGQWQSDFRATVRHCESHAPARPIIKDLRPDASDYFVLKPRHSGFYLTPLEALLDDLEIDTVILTGFATNMCVLFTAADAHMRYFRVVVPRDCVAAERPSLSRSALDHMRRAFAADTRLGRTISWSSQPATSRRSVSP